MREVGKNKHQDLWVEAMEAKFENKGTAWGRQEFEQILEGYEVFENFLRHFHIPPSMPRRNTSLGLTDTYP